LACEGSELIMNGQGDVRKNEIRKQNKAEQSVEMAISHAGPFIQNIYMLPFEAGRESPWHFE